jgi:hypothetical protein
MSALITDTEFDLEVNSRVLGDGRLAAYTGHPVSGSPSVPSASVTPDYSQYGTLVSLVQGETLLRSIARLDSAKNRKVTINNHNSSVTIVDPTSLTFSSAFTITAVGPSGVEISIGAGSIIHDSTDTIEEITASTTMQYFTQDRFAIGIKITRSLIGFIGSVYSVVTGVVLAGRKAKIT